jgi:hypothetical protein
MSDAREVGILFSGPMVRSLLSGNKTETRRILKDAPPGDGWHCDRTITGLRWVASAGSPSMPVKSRWNVGDRLWVRETFARVGDNDDDIHACPDLTKHVYFRADSVQPEVLKWRPSIFMPRWASRITLEVTALRVERLQDITCAGAIAEGIPVTANFATIDCDTPDPREGYAVLWDRINGPGSWDANPFVSVTTFRRIAPATGGAADG